MPWRKLLFEPDSSRLLCWWRALVYLSVALTATFSLLLVGTTMVSFFSGTALTPARSAELMVSLLPYATISGFFLAAGWTLRTFENLPIETLGLQLRPVSLMRFCVTLVIGICLPILVIGFLLLLGKAEIHFTNIAASLWRHLGLLSLAALIYTIAEEIVVHGYIFQTLLRGIGALPALLLLAGATIAFYTLQNPPHSALPMMNIFLLVLLFGLLYLRSGTLWVPIGLSTGWSIGQLLFNSPAANTAPLQITLHGAQWIIGPTGDPMGGAAASAVLLAVIALVTHMKPGLALDSDWWKWRNLFTTQRTPPAWDFSIGADYYQFK